MRTLWKLRVAFVLWVKYSLPWRDQYMKFSLRSAYQMANDIWEFRQFLRERGLTIERER